MAGKGHVRESSDLMTTKLGVILRIALAAAFVAVGIVGALQAQDFTDVGRWFPYYTSLGITIVGSVVLFKEVLAARGAAAAGQETSALKVTQGPVVAPRAGVQAGADPTVEHAESLNQAPRVGSDGDPVVEDDAPEDERQPLGRMLLWWGIAVAFAGLVYVVGLLVAVPVFLVLALRYGAQRSWLAAILSSAVATGLIFALQQVMQLPLPKSLLFG